MIHLLGILVMMSPFILGALFFYVADLPDPSWDEMSEVYDWMFWLEHDLDHGELPTGWPPTKDESP